MPNPWVQFVREFAKRKGVSYMCASSMPECREEYQAKKSAVERSTKGKAKIDTKKQSTELFRELNLERTKRAMKQPQPANMRVGKKVTVKKSQLNKPVASRTTVANNPPVASSTPVRSASSEYEQILAKTRESLKSAKRRGKSIAKASFEGID